MDKVSATSVLRIGCYELFPMKQKLVCHTTDGQSLERKLSFREASVLTLLIEAGGEVVENKLLLQEFWGGYNVYSLNSLYVFMTRLKQILAHDEHLSIVNARGIGYRLIVT